MLASQRRQRLRDDLSVLYAACLAAQRADAAHEVASILIVRQNDPAARVALVEAALRAGQARPRHREWLDQAAGEGGAPEGLAERLEQALAGR